MPQSEYKKQIFAILWDETRRGRTITISLTGNLLVCPRRVTRQPLKPQRTKKNNAKEPAGIQKIPAHFPWQSTFK